MKQAPLRAVVRSYIGGGWGKATPDSTHVKEAFVIRGTDFKSIASADTRGVPYRYHKETNARSRALEEGDIVFEVSGGSKDQPVGRSLLMAAERIERFSAAVIPASFCKRISPNKDLVDPGFLQAHLQLAWVDRRIVQWQVQSTGISNFKFEDFLDQFVLEVPPLVVQRRIAGILSAYDELVENNHERIRILETVARAIYREWFVHFRFPGHTSHPLVPSRNGEMPKGWEEKPLDSLIVGHIGGGWGKDPEDEKHTEPAWVIRGTDIPGARSCHVDSVPHRYHKPSNLRSRRLTPGDLVFEVSGGSKGQPLGRTLLVTPELLSAFDGDVMCASFCKRVQPDIEGYGAELLYLSILEGYESGEIEQFQVQSTGISNFKWKEYLADTQRIVPPANLRTQFREYVRPLLTQIATLGLKIQNLRRTRDLLLPRLLSGQLELEDA
ncbi:MAG: restriction endonuclease subunit S [Planctomycetota bacterium]